MLLYPDPRSLTPRSMKILFASGNAHKVAEVRAIAAEAGCPFELVGLGDIGLKGEPEPVEDGKTFEANAIIKAVYYAKLSGLPTLADDSGIEVDALGGEPGVHSARYSGLGGPRSTVDPANNAKLLAELNRVPDADRTARFCACIALVLPGQKDALATTEGFFEGRILRPDECDDATRPEAGRGGNGFGYDPLLVLEDGRTSAQLSEQEKNARSHRGQAMRAMIRRLAALQAAGEL